MKKLKNELLTQIKFNFMIIITSMVHTLFKNQFVSSPLRFSAVQWSRGHQEFVVYKTVMYFNIYIAGCYFHICFIFIVNCNIKQTSKLRGVLLNSFKNSFINFLKVKVDLMYTQKPRKINKKDFILCSVAKITIPFPIKTNCFPFVKETLVKATNRN